jgi:hypothetical protein
MIDRIVHHAEVASLRGDLYRLRSGIRVSQPAPELPECGFGFATHPVQIDTLGMSIRTIEDRQLRLRPRLDRWEVDGQL